MSPVHIRRKLILQRDAEGAILVKSAQNLDAAGQYIYGWGDGFTDST
jgi:hypothetical protein